MRFPVAWIPHVEGGKNPGSNGIVGKIQKEIMQPDKARYSWKLSFYRKIGIVESYEWLKAMSD